MNPILWRVMISLWIGAVNKIMYKFKMAISQQTVFLDCIHLFHGLNKDNEYATWNGSPWYR